ncbi:MAG: hypothetical protein AAF092_14040 [Pseudomonadota bacterium]
MYKMTRRNVIATMTGSAVMLCPAILNAQSLDLDWGSLPDDTPVGEDMLITLPAGPGEVDVTALEPGEVAIVARPSDDPNFTATGGVHYVAIMRRTAAQVAFGADNDPAGAVQNAEYFVVNLVCSHRGKAIGLTGDPSRPFACLDRRGRHASDYDASGFGVAGASDGESLSFPSYSIAVGDTVVVALA